MSFYRFNSVGQITVDGLVAAAASCAGCVCVCEGCKVYVQMKEQLSTFTLDSEVDVVCCKGGDVHVVVAADRSGYVHVISSPTQQNNMSSFSVTTSSDQRIFSAINIVSCDLESLCLLLLTDSLYLLNISSEGEQEYMMTFNVHNDICLGEYYNNNIILTGGVESLTLWQLNESLTDLSPLIKVSTILLDNVVLRVQATPDNKYIITLTRKGEIQVWLAEMMIMCRVWGGREKKGQPFITQFSLSTNKQRSKKHHLCLLCNDQTKEKLIITSVPDIEQLFCIDVIVGSVLAVGQPLQGDVCVLQPLNSQCVDVAILECGSPEERLSMLINEGRYKEAEDLVQEQDLDPMMILCKKMAMLNQLVCEGYEDKLQPLLECLDQIKDMKLISRIVLESNYPTLTITQSILTTFCNLIADYNSDTGRAVTTALDKLTTFSLITDYYDNFNEMWSVFQRGTSWYQILCHLLYTNRISHANIIWLRHKQAVEAELIDMMNSDQIPQLIPSDISLMNSWLQSTILPFILTHCPHLMREYLSEIVKTLCSLEYTDKDNWPDNALSLTKQLLISITSLDNSWSIDVSPLNHLKENLEKFISFLIIIKSHISFSEYEQSSSEQLVYRVFDQIVSQSDLVHLIISNQFTDFIKEHTLNVDVTLSKYIKLFLARVPTHSPDFIDSIWETKIITLINSVTSPDLRIDNCLHFIHSINMPWSNAVTNLVTDCIALTTGNTTELQKLYNLLQMKTMLNDRYDVKDFNYNENTGQLYIHRILRHQGTNVLSDALSVAAMYDIQEERVYMYHLFNLCYYNVIEEAQDVLYNIRPSIRITTAKISLSFCLHRLKLPFIKSVSEPTSYIAAAQFAILCAGLLQSNEWSDDVTNIQQLKYIRDLAMEYSLFLTPYQLSSYSYTVKLLRESLTAISPSSSYKYMRLGRLLGYSEDEVCCEMIRLCIEQNQYIESLALIDQCPANLILSLVNTVISSSSTTLTPNITHCLCIIMRQITTTCLHDDIEVALHMFQGCFLFNELLRNDNTSIWPWCTRLVEQGIQLEMTQIRQLAIEIITTLLQRTYPSNTSTSDCSGLVDLLQSNGHHCLAYHTTILCNNMSSNTTTSDSLLSSILEKVLSMSKVDHSYGLALLLTTSSDNALCLLQSRQSSILSSYSRVIAMCRLTIDFCQLINIPPQVSKTASALMTGALWGKLLRNYQISFSAAFRGGHDEKKKVLYQMLPAKNITSHMVLAYSRTFGLDGEGSLLTRLRIALTEWDCGYYEAFNATKKHPFTPNLLETFLTSRVCPYDYERIEFVLDQLKDNTQHHKKMSLLLPVLKAYSRSHTPSDEEREWHSSHCHSICRTSEIYERLPVHLLLQPQLRLRLIMSEVKDCSSVARLAPIASMIDIPDEVFYSSVLTTLSTSRLSYKELRPILDDVCDLNLQLTLNIQLISQLSSDTERICVLETTLALLQESSGHELTYDKESLSQQLRETKVRILLDEVGIATEETNISSIINILYNDIPLRHNKPAAVDVHQLTQNIGDILNVNILPIIKQLLEEWLLPSTNKQRDLNTTLMREMTESTEDDNDSENWTKMMYLMTDNPYIESLTIFLCCWAKMDSTILKPSSRQRALQLLLTTVPSSIIERLSKDTIANLREQVQEAVFVTELSYVQVSLRVDTFKCSNKQTLANNLLNSRPDSPKAVRLVGDLCIHYKLTDSMLWTRLLNTLLTLNMTEYLQQLLPQLIRHNVHYDMISNISSVWQPVVISYYETGGGESGWVSGLNLLYQCPMLFKIDIQSIIDIMSGVGANSHALSAIQLLPPSLRTSATDSVMEDIKDEGILHLLDDVTQSSYTHLSLVSDVVYDYIDRKRKYECLLGTQYFSDLIHYLISHDSIDSLLHITITKGRITEAIQLVEMYNNHHYGDDVTSSVTGLHGLKVYLEAHKHLDLIPALELAI